MKSKIVVVVYRPLPGKEQVLQKVLSKHMTVLRGQALVTDRNPTIMRSSDGCYVEVFEWLSAEAIEKAHNNSEVLKLWDEFSAVCTYEKPVNVPAFHQLFSEFEPVALD